MAQAGEGAYFWICTMHREILFPRPLTDIALLAFSVYVHLRNLPSCINRVCCHLEPEQNQALLSCGQLHVHKCSQADSWGHRCHQWTLWACFYALVNRKSWQVRKNHPDYEKERAYWSLLIHFCWQYHLCSIGTGGLNEVKITRSRTWRLKRELGDFFGQYSRSTQVTH